MSWEIFKQNIVRISNRPGSIPDIDTVARAYAVEYDAAIKRGFDTINNIAIQQGDVATMERLFKIALQNKKFPKELNKQSVATTVFAPSFSARCATTRAPASSPQTIEEPPLLLVPTIKSTNASSIAA